jgi:hypothetical protein
VLGAEEEKLLLDRIVAWSECGVHLTRSEVSALAKILFADKVDALRRPFNAGGRWLRGFLKRHREAIRYAQSVDGIGASLIFCNFFFPSRSSRTSRFTDFRRVLAATNESLTATWEGITAVINRYKIKPHRVFCLDETHVQPQAKTSEKVVVPPSVKLPRQPK